MKVVTVVCELSLKLPAPPLRAVEGSAKIFMLSMLGWRWSVGVRGIPAVMAADVAVVVAGAAMPAAAGMGGRTGPASRAVPEPPWRKSGAGASEAVPICGDGYMAMLPSLTIVDAVPAVPGRLNIREATRLTVLGDLDAPVLCVPGVPGCFLRKSLRIEPSL
jgi:hypothetical protein